MGRDFGIQIMLNNSNCCHNESDSQSCTETLHERRSGNEV